jgi:DNA-binding CsgD family transcriptional regulator
MDVFTHGNWQGFPDRGLTGRETEITLGVVVGKTNKEIGRLFGIAPDTVKKRIRSAMDRLGVDRRAALVSEAIRRGIIAPLLILLALAEVAPHQQVQTRPVRAPVAVKRIAKAGREMSQPMFQVAC